MTYHEYMEKIKELPGWTWEWKFGDKCYDLSNNESAIVVRFITNSNKGAVCIVNSDIMRRLEEPCNLIPLPSVEQWIKKFVDSGWDTLIERHGNSYFVNVGKIGSPADESLEYDGEWLDEVLPQEAIAILYARVVLGYKLVDGEFVKC